MSKRIKPITVPLTQEQYDHLLEQFETFGRGLQANLVADGPAVIIAPPTGEPGVRVEWSDTITKE